MRDGQATVMRTTFRLAIAVSTRIEASASTIWALLTDLDAQSRWNSTLASIDGKVALGERVSFRVPEAPREDLPGFRADVRADGRGPESSSRGRSLRLTCRARS